MTDAKNATLITRDEAMALGLRRFFTGKPCINGHVAERYVSRACVECVRLSAAESYRTRPDKVAMADRTRAHHAKVGRYVPPPLERDCPPRPWDGGCDCCLKLVSGSFCLDHDHETGAFRGWICISCNTATGIIDDSERLRNRADFLEGNLPWQ